MKTVLRSALAVAVVLILPGLALAQMQPKAGPTESTTLAMVPAAKVIYQPLAIPGFDPGVKLAAINGDPNAESGFYVIRLSFPAGYKFPAHWHPMAENLTVLQGELLLGMGNKTDPTKLTGYKVGSFLYLPGKMAHFGGARGATVIQLHGQAPFKIELAK